LFSVTFSNQSLARLFYESEWTQERIAAKIGMSPDWVGKHLRFGRFLEFVARSTTGTEGENPPLQPPKSLTERRFRSAWERTEASGKHAEEERFRQVIQILDEASLHFKRRFSAKELIALFPNGRWFNIKDCIHLLKAEPSASKAIERRPHDPLPTRSAAAIHDCLVG
jgi:hypothetical protein